MTFSTRPAKYRTATALLALMAGAALPVSHAAAQTQAPTALPPVSVQTDQTDETCPLHTTTIDKKDVDAQSILGATDTAALLNGAPGVAMATGGGISSLPILRGIADDRNKTVVDGMALTSACPNHMNPALSYIAPGNTGKITSMAGITPVSQGGDSIGGTIIVDPAKPMFANPGEDVAVHGSTTTSYRSINRQVGVSGDIAAATERFSVGYNGGWTRARDSHDGNGDIIRASKFENQNHNATLAAQTDNALMVVRAGHQMTPYEGFPNARMDLTGNTSNYVNGSYQGGFDWGKIDGKVYWQHATHSMDFLPGERNTTGHMPMNTDAVDIGYALNAEIPLTAADTLRVGNEYHGYRLNDWWPPISSSPNGMMSPNTFININEGTRKQIGTYAELEKKWDSQWTTLAGLRNDIIMMNTGNVAGYSMARYGTDAATFNAQEHSKTDVNYDLTLTTRYEATAINTEELGFARKTRSPNLYERYAWSTGGMAASMINWFGNGTEYVGNVNLRPETANTLSITSGWHDAARQDWDVKVTPYYTYIQDYIGVNNLGKNGSTTPGVALLQFANHDAQMFGFDVSGSKVLVKDSAYGSFNTSGTVGLARGMQVNNGNRLYHMQPLNAQISLNHKLGGWTNTLEARLVDDKSITNPDQNEQTTPGFAIMNWRTSYKLDNVTFAAGVDNIFNKQYYDPNGGANVSYWRATNTNAAMGALPAAGRSYNLGMTVSF